jgi:hypothetical protein
MATYRARSALGAEAVTPATQAAAAARDGFVTYDQLSGPDLDAARWSPARLPLPTGAEHIPLDPNAELTVGRGEVGVRIPRFSLSHDRFQGTVIPDRVRLGFGIWTMLPIRDGRTTGSRPPTAPST